MGLGGAIFLLLARSPIAAALLAAFGGAVQAAWILWLRGHLRGTEISLVATGLASIIGLTATLLVLRQGRRGRLFRLVLSVAFGYLALVAVRNINLFGLVAGFVIAWNLGEWAFELGSSREESAPPQVWLRESPLGSLRRCPFWSGSGSPRLSRAASSPRPEKAPVWPG